MTFTLCRPRSSGRFLLAATLVFGLSACQSSEERAEEYFRSAMDLVAAGDADRAIVELRNVFQLNGQHREARRELARLMLDKGNTQEAYSQLLRLVEQYPDDTPARIQLAELAFAARNWDELERHGAAAAAQAPDDPRVKALALARTYRGQVGENAEVAARRATAQAARALQAELPDSPVLRNLLIDSLMRDADYAAALGELDKIIAAEPDNRAYFDQKLAALVEIGEPAAIEAHLRDMIARFPDEAEFKSRLIRFLLARREIDAAETFLRELVAAAPPEEEGVRADLVRFLAEVRGREAALAELETLIAASPDPASFRVLRAGFIFETGKREEAVAEIEAVLAGEEASERSRRFAVVLARMYLAMGNEVGARARVEEVLAQEPSNPEALKMRAAWAIAADDTDGAIAALRTALDNAPEDAQAMTLMAEAYNRSGERDLERDFLSLAVEASRNAPAETLRYARLLIAEGRWLPAEDVLLPALRQQPAHVDLLATLGRVYLGLKDIPRVEHVIQTLRRVEAPEARPAADALEAARLAQVGGTAEAMGFIEELAGTAGAGLGAKLPVVRARLATGDVPGALAAAEELVAADPGNETLRFVLGATRAAAGELDGAETIYRELLAQDPKRARVWLELSRVLRIKGDGPGARAAIEDGLRVLPEDPTLLWAQAGSLEQEGDVDGAIGIYERLYAQNSAALVVANNLASLLATWREDPESLERAWTIARRFRDTRAPAVQDTYGWILHRRGQSEEALPYLEAAAAGLPGDALVQYHLAAAYAALGRTEAALAQMKKAVEVAGPADQRPQIQTARAEILRLQSAPEPGQTPAQTPGQTPGQTPSQP